MFIDRFHVNFTENENLIFVTSKIDTILNKNPQVKNK